MPTNGLDMCEALISSITAKAIITLGSPMNTIVHVNRAWTMLTGYEQHHVEGRDYATLARGGLANQLSLSQALEEVCVAGKSHVQLQILRRNGTSFFCDLSLRPIKSYDYYGAPYLSHCLVTMVATPTDQISNEKVHTNPHQDLAPAILLRKLPLERHRSRDGYTTSSSSSSRSSSPVGTAPGWGWESRSSSVDSLASIDSTDSTDCPRSINYKTVGSGRDRRSRRLVGSRSSNSSKLISSSRRSSTSSTSTAPPWEMGEGKRNGKLVGSVTAEDREDDDDDDDEPDIANNIGLAFF